jgi:hypothetical protein
LGDVQALGRTAEVKLIRHDEEVPELPKFHKILSLDVNNSNTNDIGRTDRSDGLLDAAKDGTPAVYH